MPHFCFRPLPQVSTLTEIPQGNTLENSGKQNPKMGFKSPPSTGGNRACSKFCRLFDRFRAPKIGIPVEKESAQGSPDLVYMAHDLGIAEIRSFLDTAKTSDSLEQKLYKVGSLIFAYGKEQRMLVLNPFDEIDRPKVAYTVPEILEAAQFNRLLETAEEEVPELIPFLAMAGFAGVRRSELVREYAEDQVLRWEESTGKNN